MRPIRIILVLTVVGLFVVATAVATMPIGEQQTDNDFNQDQSIDTTPGIPEPIPPVSGATADEPLQLVGFTGVSLAGNLGILNYTLACQTQFENSRMCTYEEIVRTIRVPAAPGVGFAWVRTEDGLSGPVDDCRGWTSDSADDIGLAVSLGCDNCYGGLRATSCDSRLAVACCAPAR